jgi:hypothetical protein
MLQRTLSWVNTDASLELTNVGVRYRSASAISQVHPPPATHPPVACKLRIMGWENIVDVDIQYGRCSWVQSSELSSRMRMLDDMLALVE